MQSVSGNYEEMRQNPRSTLHVRCRIPNGSGGYFLCEEDKIVSLSTKNSIFESDTPSVGGVIARVLDMKVRNPDKYPRMAQINVFLRYEGTTYSIVNGQRVEERSVTNWIPKGVFFIDTRSVDRSSGVMTIRAYDCIVKLDNQMYKGEVDLAKVWPKAKRFREVATLVAEKIGTTVDAETLSYLNTVSMTMQFPGYASGSSDGSNTTDNKGDGVFTMREILSYIASACGGNWISNDTGQLKLVRLNGIPSETHYLVTEYGSAITLGGTRILV